MKTCSLALLGSTGSIGKSALAVVRALPDRIRVSLLAAGRNWELLAEQAREFRPACVCLEDAAHLDDLRAAVPAGCRVISGRGKSSLLRFPAIRPGKLKNRNCARCMVRTSWWPSSSN